jgi:hypothetical protein
MHTIHTTEGFVIGSRASGEAGKTLSIFTRDLGLIQAVAQGIRLEKSKLRYHTQDYSFGIYSLVKGREYWRLTGTQELRIENIESGIVNHESGLSIRGVNRGHDFERLEIREFVAKITLLLRRLLTGEEAHPELFDCVFECTKFIYSKSGGTLNSKDMQTLESLTVARMLFLLGYIGDAKKLNIHLKSIEITRELLETLADQRTVLNQHINKALKESML